MGALRAQTQGMDLCGTYVSSSEAMKHIPSLCDLRLIRLDFL